MVSKTQEIKPAQPVLKWRFYCEACTGRAMYAPEKFKFNSISCRNCGAVCVDNANNWLEVTDPDEFRKINGGVV